MLVLHRLPAHLPAEASRNLTHQPEDQTNDDHRYHQQETEQFCLLNRTTPGKQWTGFWGVGNVGQFTQEDCTQYGGIGKQGLEERSNHVARVINGGAQYASSGVSGRPVSAQRSSVVDSFSCNDITCLLRQYDAQSARSVRGPLQSC